jgi:ferric-dicitrate binding protein FerR (iron transport regulator)
LAEGADAAGSVTEIKGEAFAEAAAAKRSLETRSPVFVNDRVNTGPASRLTLLLGRNTTIRLGEQVRFIIDRFLQDVGGEITLATGAMLLDHPAQTPPLQMQIRSSFGLIAVRGTRFFAGPSGGAFGVFVESGSVVVSAAGRRVVVNSGKGTQIRREGAQPSAPARWSRERIRAAYSSVT